MSIIVMVHKWSGVVKKECRRGSREGSGCTDVSKNDPYYVVSMDLTSVGIT
jgi:hypothetical protein